MMNRTAVLVLMTAVLAAGATLGLARRVIPLVSPAGAQDAMVVRAQRFDLVDAAGVVRGGMAIDSAGHPIVTLLDEAGQTRVAIQPDAGGEYFVIVSDARGVPRFAAGTSARGFAGLNLRDGAGTIRANIFAADDGNTAGFQVFDVAGERIWRAP